MFLYENLRNTETLNQNAPELLEGLEVAISTIERLFESLPNEKNKELILSNLESVVAKAKGEIK